MCADQRRELCATPLRSLQLLRIACARHHISNGVVGARRAAVKCDAVHFVELQQ